MKKTVEALQEIDKEFLTVGELAEFMGVSKKTMYKYIRSFNFRMEKVGRKILIPKRAFIEFVLRTE